MTTFLIAGLMRNISLYKMSYYPQRDSHSRNKIKFELGLSNYATKSEVEGTTGVDTSKFGRKGDLANIKSKVNQLHFNCPELTSNDFYLEETGRRTNKDWRIIAIMIKNRTYSDIHSIVTINY